MALKEFNAKQFLLEKGEWVGLGLALLITLPVLAFGMMMILTSRSPASNAQDIDQLAKAAEQRINSARPPEDADKPPKEVDTVVSYDRVDPDQYSTPVNWFIAGSIEDTRRRSPEILPPGEFHVEYVRGGIKGYILDGTGKRVMVIEKKSALVVRDKKTKKNIKLDQRMGALSGGDRGGRPGMPGGGRGYGGPAYGPSVGGGAPGGGLGVPSTSFQDIDKVGNNPDVRLAEQIIPVRMAIVTGTFPFRQQMEEFRRALKKRSLEELFAMIGSDEASWQFKGFKIQRRVFYPDGREKSPWQDYEETLNSKFGGLFAVSVDYEKEEPDYYKYEGILNRGLMMVRPQLERGQYPKAELDSLKNAVTKLDKESQGPEVKRPLSELSRQLQQKGINVWDPLNPFLTEEEEANKAMQEKPSQPSTESSEKKPEKKDTDTDSELLIPDKALVRFIDVTVEPGFVYEYRIKVRMANPNYHKTNLAYSALKELKEIEAGEWTLGPRVEVPYDIYYYAMDEKPDRDKTIVQIHRWVDYLLKDPQNENTKSPLGDWTIAEKLPVHRGEYIGELFETKVPVWNIEKEDYELAVNPKSRLSRKIPVDYAVRTSKALDPALLVDYQGGKDLQDRLEIRTLESNKAKSSLAVDTVPVQMLILTPEGKLIVHNYQDDTSNEERVARHKAWKDWVNDIETGRRKPKPDEPLMDQFRGGGKSN
jgi:hypothetical protein